MNKILYRQIHKISKSVPRNYFDLRSSTEWSHNWHGLIKFMLKWLQRWNVLDPFLKENLSFYTYGIREADSLTKAIALQHKGIAKHLGPDSDDMVLIIGEEQFMELRGSNELWFDLNPEPGQAYLGGLQFGQQFKNGFRALTTIWGIPVVVVPWFDSFVLVPRRSILQQSRADKNVKHTRDPSYSGTSLLGG